MAGRRASFFRGLLSLTQHHLSACVKLFVKKIYKFNFNEIFNQINMDCKWFKGIKRRKLLLEEWKGSFWWKIFSHNSEWKFEKKQMLQEFSLFYVSFYFLFVPSFYINYHGVSSVVDLVVVVEKQNKKSRFKELFTWKSICINSS